MAGHARLGPSNHRWPNCPGSVREEANYVDVAGEAAIDGTGSHLLLEMCMENNVLAIQYDQQIIGANHPDQMGGWLVGPERIARVQMCLDYIQRRVNELKTEYPHCTVTVESESTSDPGALFGRDDWWGTCDITITAIDAEGVVWFLEAADYKDGRGWVNAKDNTQLISYLGGKIGLHHKVLDCRMAIIQPKTNPVIRYQCSKRPDDNLSVEGVMQRLAEMNEAAKETDKPDAPTRSGKHCQWCKANPKRGGHCVTATEQSIQVVKNMSNTEVIASDATAFEYISKVVADPTTLTNEQLSELLSAKDALMAAFDKCESEIQTRIEQGQHVSGYAMLPGNSTRKWNASEEDIAKMLKGRRIKLDEIYPKKLVSVAAMLKSSNLTDAQKKKIEEDYVSEIAGKITLKKVAHSVAQSTTNDVDSVKQMFADVTATPEISFL